MAGRKSRTDKAVESFLGEVAFFPTTEMRNIKSRLILALEDNPITSIEELTCANAVHLTREGKIQKWWTTPGFKEWLTNTEEFREKLETSKTEMVDLLRELAMDPALGERSRIQAAKILLETATKYESTKKEEQFADSQIQKMSEEQLKQYIEKQMKYLGKVSDE